MTRLENEMLEAQEIYYAGLVSSWLSEIIVNSIRDDKPRTYSDVAEDIKFRAQTGLTKYFRDNR